MGLTTGYTVDTALRLWPSVTLVTMADEDGLRRPLGGPWGSLGSLGRGRGALGRRRAPVGLRVELGEGGAADVDARGAGESVLLDGAADEGHKGGELGVGEVD